MKHITILLILVLILTGFTFTQERPEKDMGMIITPDGKLMSRIDGSITEPNYKLNTLNKSKLENDAPIGTPYSWDNNLSFNSSTFNSINAIVVSGSDVYIGGDFTNAMFIGANYIIRWNQKNNTWHTIGTGNELNGPVHAIAVSGNDVYVGGEFTDAGGDSSADHIARWDGNNWNALDIGLNDNVYAIAIQGSNVYVGGSFISAGGNFESDYIARWDGSNWNAMGQLDNSVRAIAVSGTEVFVGGAFTSASSAGSNYFATYDGAFWGSLGTPLNGEVRAIAISGTDLYIGGAFTDAGGNANADAVAYFDLNTFSGWQALGNGIIKFDYYPGIAVRSLAAFGDDLYVGGEFWSPYNSYFNHVAYWNGTTWDSLDTGLFSDCRALALSGTDLLAGGNGSGFSRWFGAYASGIYGGVQKPLTDPTGFVEFNTSNDSTVVRLELNYGSGYTGVFNVFCYEDKILDGTILPVANHRWIVQQNGIPNYAISGNIRIKIVDLPDSSGIIYPGSSGIYIFQRSTPGRGVFTDLTPWSWYDFSTGEYVIAFTGVGEFAIGLHGTVDGIIDPGEYVNHVEGQNQQTSDGKTWYMRSDEYFLYIGISNYTDSSDAINIYLDNSNIGPSNLPGHGTFIGTGNDGLTPNLPFGADYYAYIKPNFDEYGHKDGYGWFQIETNRFIKSYSLTNQVLEIAIPWSTTPYSELNNLNGFNVPIYGFNWLGFLSNSATLFSRVPEDANPSGEANDLVWYYHSNLYANTFDNESYTHIGPSINLGVLNCYDFNYNSPLTTINRISGEWNIENGLFIKNGTLTFQNNDSVKVGFLFSDGGTINFSYNTFDAPLVIQSAIYDYPAGDLFMDDGHYTIFINPSYPSGNLFRSNEIFPNIVIDNPLGVSLYSDMKINQSLTLLNGNIQTITYDTFYVILNIGAIIGGSGYIEGSLEQYVDLAPGPNGGDSPDNLVVNFPVGTANGPSPVSVDFSSITSGGKLTVQAFQNVHPNTINSSETLGRYWRITKDEDLTFTSADITFNYRPEDFNGTTFSEATDEASMIVGKYDASWSYPSIFTRTPGGINDGGSITISGVTSFSDFTMFKSQLSANVRVFLEGPYLSDSMSTALNTGGSIPLSQPYFIGPWDYNGTETVASIPSVVVDWVLLELRSNPTTQVARRAAFLRNNGSLVDLDGTSYVSFPGVPAGNYYLVIYHRNHIPIMTAGTVSLSETPALYDISTGQGQAYGTNAMKDLGGGVFGLFTADTDGSGTINATDRSNTWNQRNLSGYYGTDVDLSGTVNAADRSSVWNNRNISTQVPTPVDGPVIEIVKENNK